MIVLSFYKYHGNAGPALESQLRFMSQSHTSNATSLDCQNAFQVPSCAGFEFHLCKIFVVGKDTISQTLVVFVTTWDNNFVIVLVTDWWMRSSDRKTIKTFYPLVRWSLACA